MRLKVAEQRKKPAAAHTPKGRNPFILDKYGCRIIKRNKTKQNITITTTNTTDRKSVV